MRESSWVSAVRSVGFLYGVLSLTGGVAIFVLFVSVPSTLLSQLPPWLGRLLVSAPPWLVTVGGQGSTTGFLATTLASLAFVVYGVWALRTALFADTASLSPGIFRSGD